MICKCLMMLMLLIDRCLLWRTPSMFNIISSFVILWSVQRILVKQCITSPFYENLVMLVHSVMWHSKLPDKMYTALNFKKHSVNTMYHIKNTFCAFILLWSLYWCHAQRKLTLFHWLFWTIHSIMRLNMMLRRTSCFHKLKYFFQGHKHGL